jgi:hypothetical protein
MVRAMQCRLKLPDRVLVFKMLIDVYYTGATFAPKLAGSQLVTPQPAFVT